MITATRIEQIEQRQNGAATVDELTTLAMALGEAPSPHYRSAPGAMMNV